jgi:hypothetical protein
MGGLDNLWGALPLAAYLGLAAGQARRGRAGLEALLRAAVWWAAGVWVLANGLGAFGALRLGPLKITWALLAAGALADGFRARARWRFPRPENLGERAAALGIGALLLLALVVAVAAPPVTVDVLNYHLPRQLMWLQQGGLAHFLTANDRQLVMPPLAEVVGLQWFALTGDDRWANLPQWFAYALLPLAAVRAARAGGATRGAAALAAWLAVCLPMAWHEASNGKNDLQGALWLTVLLWQVAEARRTACGAPVEPGGRPSRGDAVFVGVTLALALLTKSTAMLFAPPLLVAGWLAWRRAGGASNRTPEPDPAAHAAGYEESYKGGREKPVALRVSAGTPTALVWRRAGLAALAAALLTAPFFARNLAWFGSPLGEQQAAEGGAQANAAVTPGVVASNVLRNATLHLSAPSPAWNAALDRGVRAAHGALGLDVDDRRDTLYLLRYAVTYEPRTENSAGAPWHFLLIAAAVAGALAGGRSSAVADWRWLAWGVAAMALLLCAALRWQPWGARLQLPVFAAGCVLAAGAGAALLPARWRAAAGWGAALLGLAAWWPARETTARPLWTSPTVFSLPRELSSYRYRPELLPRDRGLAALAREAGARDVQIVSVHDSAYGLMRRLAAEIPDVHFYGAPAADQALTPDALVVLNVGEPLPLFYDGPGGARYRLTGAGAGDGLYLPEARVRALGWERRLPAFAGWTTQKNFPLRIAEPVDLAAPVSTRTLAVEPVTLTYPVAWPGGRARLAGVVRAPAADSTPSTSSGQAGSPQATVALELSVNGAPAGRVEFSPGEAPQSFEIWLPVRPGANTLELRRAPADGAPIVFTRLTIDDGAEP